ncbi:MAG: hypothetical protein QOI54_1190 [Actinomycetota bacterium]|nr:hypothetical protein [Actinomycetota bacterium]
MTAVLALFSSLLWGSADFLGGTLSRRFPAVLVVGVSQLAGLVVAVAVALVAGQLGASGDYVSWAVGAGLAGLVGLTSFYAALAAGTMSVVSPVAALGVVVPVLVGLGRGERPGTVQLVGIAVAVVGVVLASGPELSRRAGARPLLLAAAAAVGFGLALVFIAQGSRSSALMTMVVMRATSVPLLGVLVAVGAYRARRARRNTGRLSLDARDVALFVAVGIGDVGANLTFAVASTRGLVSVLAVLASLYPVVTVLLARAVHREELGRVQAIGVAGALTGVVMIGVG